MTCRAIYGLDKETFTTSTCRPARKPYVLYVNISKIVEVLYGKVLKDLYILVCAAEYEISGVESYILYMGIKSR